MVARGAGAAGPVLLACRQWDPLGLARWLPSLGVGAWCSAPLLPWRVQCPVRVCAALAASSGGLGPVHGVASPPFPPSCPACPALCVAGRHVRVSLTLARWYAFSRGLCVPPARSGCPSGSPRVPFVCVCARAPPASAFPPPWVVWRAHLARSRCWALVGPFHVVRAPLRVLPRSLAPFGVLGGGRPGPGSPLPGLGLCAPRWVGLRIRGVPVPGGGVGVGGAARAPRPPFVRPGGPVGRGVALRCSVPLPSLGRQQSGCHWRCSGHGGCGPHTAPVRARLPSLGAVRAVSWRVGAGLLAPRGSCRSQRLGRGGGPCSGLSHGRRGPAGGEGDQPLCLGGVGAGAPAACGPAGWVGAVGWSRRGPPAPPLGSGPRFPPLPSLSSLAYSPPVCAFSRGRGAAPCTGCGLPGGGGGEVGRPMDRSPGGPCRPEPSLCPPQVGNIVRVTGDALVKGGAAPILFWCAAACCPRAWSARRSGVLVRARPSAATPAGAGGWGRSGARCAGRAGSPPLRRGPFCGRGGVASAPGGWRVGAPAALKSGGERGGGGGRSAAPRHPASSGVGLPSFVSGAPTRGILVLWGLPGGRGRRARPGRPPMGQCGGGGAGRGGAISSPWFAPPPPRGRPMKGLLRLRRPGRRRSAVGW